MANRPPAAQPLSADDRLLLKSWLTEFVQTWTESRLEESVAGLPTAGDRLRQPALVELIKVDLRRRWDRGDRVELESYLQRYPELGCGDAVAVGLVRAEYEARKKAGTSVPLEEMRRRFPLQTDSLDTGSKPAVTMLGSRGAGETILRPSPETSSLPAPSAASGAMPERIGPYAILRRLGQGGMGTVYLAHDEKLDRDVALKVPRFDPQDGPHLRERFYREAKAAAALRHPNVCSIYEIGEADGVPYLTMAYIEGRPLTDYIDRNGVAPVQAALLARKLALALREAHKLGIVHRDLKPANIMIDQRKEPVIMDFGLARLEHQELAVLRQHSGNGIATAGDRENDRLTRMGAILGTPQYMAPEQVAGDLDAMGPGCDIYSLGVILYELLTGRTPFAGPPAVVLAQVMSQPVPPPTEYRANLDPELAALSLKAVAQKPADRYVSMDDFATDLGAYLKSATRGQSTPPVAQLVPVAQAAPVAQVVPVARIAPALQVPSEERPRRPPTVAPLSSLKSLNWAILGPILGGCVCAFAILIWAVIDLSSNDNAPAPAGSTGSMRLTFTNGLRVQRGYRQTWQVHIARQGFAGPVQVQMEDLPATIACSPVTLPPDSVTVPLTLIAALDAQPGTYNVRIVATTGKLRLEEPAQLTVLGPRGAVLPPQFP
jgi:serine/threonine protein kinase